MNEKQKDVSDYETFAEALRDPKIRNVIQKRQDMLLRIATVGFPGCSIMLVVVPPADKNPDGTEMIQPLVAAVGVEPTELIAAMHKDRATAVNMDDLKPYDGKPTEYRPKATVDPSVPPGAVFV